MRILNRRRRGLLGALGLVMGICALAPASSLASGNAVYTSTDATAQGCLNGAPDNDVNCNAYESKDKVYLSGGPVNGGGLGDGDYFFAILEPGSQADPTDGSPTNLSTDTYADRKINVDSGVLSNLGTHLTGTDKDGRLVVQAMPYDDTSNPGGVYILAVCKWLGDGDANDATNPSKCKYDAFKVRSETPPTVASDPVVTKDAKATFKRTFPWSIEKTVSCVGGSGPYLTYDDLVQKLGGTATCNYSIAVTKGAGVDSDWKVTGTISVFNPNAGGSVALDDVTDYIDDPDAQDPEPSCVVDTSAGLTVPAEDKVEYPYVCTYANEPDPSSGLNTAAAEWSDQDVGGLQLAASSGTGTASFAFADDDFANDNPKLVDDCAKVTDNLDGNEATLQDPLCESKTFTPSHTFQVPASGCADHSNTATVDPADVGDPSSDSTSVRICGPVGGEGTMGFWQNKNGQALIKAGTSTAGVCDSGAYLRTYNPFKDLSATATCTQVATYVTNVIKAASASGASMNAMLKGQMLSTALDVYFGKVPGNVTMDLTKVNKPIGSASYENVSAAFGGATSMTVNQMLSYASSQSNSGGSAWYGQNKSRQEKAKDALDAINNGVALSI